MYDEEENVEHALRTAADALRGWDYDIVVVDDASTDRGPEIVRRIATEDPRVRMITHDRNRKLGGSLRTGFAAARGDLVLYMDADVPFDPHEIPRAVRALDVTRADMIAGYRIDRTMEGVRRAIYSFAYNGLIGILFGWPHRDINFSFKLMRREVLDAVELRSEGSLIDAELVVKAKNLGFSIQQLGLDYFPRTRGRSHLAGIDVIVKIVRELIHLFPDMRRPRRRAATASRGATPSAAPERS
ncbi:MAG: glycosyltransferase family 2 protein [Chloroflexi bacterium]|nr:glycosyltransferase family 2 protein [Chloroflexota bacterium]MBI2983324.1 glycosyltransferase family 2 protein [Chloroflexota bacterium]